MEIEAIGRNLDSEIQAVTPILNSIIDDTNSIQQNSRRISEIKADMNIIYQTLSTMSADDPSYRSYLERVRYLGQEAQNLNSQNSYLQSKIDTNKENGRTHRSNFVVISEEAIVNANIINDGYSKIIQAKGKYGREQLAKLVSSFRQKYNQVQNYFQISNDMVVRIDKICGTDDSTMTRHLVRKK